MSGFKGIKPRFTSENQPEGRGRPKGAKSRATVLRKWLECKTKAKNPLTGELETLPVHDQVALALITKALSGDVMAIKEVQDSVYGKIPDVSRTSGTTEVVFRWDAGQLGMMQQPKELPEAIDGEVIDDDE